MYNDPNHRGNSPEYHTGKKCIAVGCENPAGTAWSPYWCFGCNVKRMSDITEQLVNEIFETAKGEQKS